MIEVEINCLLYFNAVPNATFQFHIFVPCCHLLIDGETPAQMRTTCLESNYLLLN